MRKYDVPFYPDNTKDGARCVQACFKMILKYFLPEKDFSWRELDKITYKIPKKGTWWFTAYPFLVKLGFEIQEFGASYYWQIYHRGVNYLYKIFSKKVTDFYLKESNIVDAIKFFPAASRVAVFHKKRATLKEVENFFDKGYLWIADVDFSGVFSKWYGPSHAIVITGYDKKHIYFNDPAKRGGENIPLRKHIFLKTKPGLAAFRLKS